MPSARPQPPADPAALAGACLAVLLGLAAVACGDDATTATTATTATATTGSTTTSGDGSSGATGPQATTTSTTAPVEDTDDTEPTADTGATTSPDDTGATTTDDTGTTSPDDTGPPDTGDTGDEPPPPVIPGPKLKIMSFNIRVGSAADGPNHWDKRKGLVYQVFKDQDADFIGVQEALVFQLKAIDAAVPGYERIGKATVDGKSDGPVNAIYYRKSRFEVKTSNTFWLSGTPDVVGSQTWGNKFPRAVTWGRFAEKSSDYKFYIYNTHFDHVSQNSREKSAVLLSQKIADRGAPTDPFVVMGDLNSAEGNLAIKYLKADAKIDGKANKTPLRDTYRVAHPDATNVGTAHGFNGGTGGNKIDYIFVPAKQTVHAATIDHFNMSGRYPSDHFPITATVTFADQK